MPTKQDVRLEKSELKPCPFCGTAKDYEVINLGSASPDDNWVVSCHRCSTQVGFADTAKEAVDAWNTRPSDPLLDELVEHCRNLVNEKFLVKSGADWCVTMSDIIERIDERGE